MLFIHSAWNRMIEWTSKDEASSSTLIKQRTRRSLSIVVISSPSLDHPFVMIWYYSVDKGLLRTSPTYSSWRKNRWRRFDALSLKGIGNNILCPSDRGRGPLLLVLKQWLFVMNPIVISVFVRRMPHIYEALVAVWTRTSCFWSSASVSPYPAFA